MDGLWATKSKDVELIVHAISLEDFYLCGTDPPTSQTDGRHAVASILHYSASCNKNEKFHKKTFKLRQTVVYKKLHVTVTAWNNATLYIVYIGHKVDFSLWTHESY